MIVIWCVIGIVFIGWRHIVWTKAWREANKKLDKLIDASAYARFHVVNKKLDKLENTKAKDKRTLPYDWQ